MLLTTFIVNEALSHILLGLIKMLNNYYPHFMDIRVLETLYELLKDKKTNTGARIQTLVCLVLNPIIFPCCLRREGVAQKEQL